MPEYFPRTPFQVAGKVSFLFAADASARVHCLYTGIRGIRASCQVGRGE
jgi:hypothetical protein